jgi:dipeptidyl aminopeptidase/acylaminoacyl peptidase
MAEGSSRSPGTPNEAMTIEHIAAVESPRDFQVHPRDRVVAFVADWAGAPQLFTLSLRGGPARPITASEKAISQPRWSPDGRRIAYVRDTAIHVVEGDGSRDTVVVTHPAGVSMPRWSPDGRRLAFLSRRRGWSQIWLIDAPVPRRGRPAAKPRPPEPEPLTGPGFDVDSFEWSPDGRRLAVTGERPDDLRSSRIALVDVATGEEEVVAGSGSWATGISWLPDGSLLYISDADGWFHVLRRLPGGREHVALTRGAREHGEPRGADAYRPLASPDGSRLVHVEFQDALVRLYVTDVAGAPAPRGRGRPPKTPRIVPGAAEGRRIDPWDGAWRIVGWLADGSWVAAIGDSQHRPPDLWLLPVPGVAPDAARPRQVTESMPAILAPAFDHRRAAAAERISFDARDGLRIEGTLWRPPRATGRRGGDRVPAILYPHGGPTSQSLRSWAPFKQLLVREGFAFLDVDFRGSTGYGRAFREANRGEWGHADTHDMIDAARWAREQPWCDGRLAIYGGSYGGYLVLCALVEEPSLWRAGVDLYGDSEISESFRHGDRRGRLDLQRMMGSPDDPEMMEMYRRGSPVFRAERIEAPLLILHGRRDKRVVPLMTERMVEALEIEGKHHEVHWYDDESHGWERRENRRDAWQRILTFLRRHVLDQED